MLTAQSSTGIPPRRPAMKAVRSYASRIEAELDRIQLDVEGIPAQVTGVGSSMEGGIGGVQLQVPDECVDAALALLDKN